MKRNVLIFGGGGYNAIQVYFALKDTVRFQPILASSNDNHSVFVDKNAIINLPYDSDPGFIEALNACIENNNIEFIIPTHDTAAVTLMKNKEVINATIVCSCYETTRICRYKSRTYEVLKDLDFVPKLYKIADENIEFPVFAKDDIGQGGRNALKINSREEFRNLDSDIEYVICEYLPGEEITIDCFTDRHGKLRLIQPRSRSRLLNGISARAYFVELTDEIKQIAEQIASRIKFRGYWFIQCKKDVNGKYKLMEISTRFAGTFALTKNLDVNLPLLAVSDFADIDISIKPNTCMVVSDKSYIDRYHLDYNYERVYIDFDDTLVFDRKRYNTEAMRFIYQCLNEKKEIVLITKHPVDIRETMANIRMSEKIFDSILEVPIEEPKYLFMDNSKPSIFIDNAFAERIAVKEHLGIPTFDISNIECLIDWRM